MNNSAPASVHRYSDAAIWLVLSVGLPIVAIAWQPWTLSGAALFLFAEILFIASYIQRRQSAITLDGDTITVRRAWGRDIVFSLSEVTEAGVGRERRSRTPYVYLRKQGKLLLRASDAISDFDELWSHIDAHLTRAGVVIRNRHLLQVRNASVGA
jgi:hypothetical protein